MSGAEDFYIYQFAAALSRSNQPCSSLSARPETPDQPAGRPVLQDRGTLLDSPGGVNRFLELFGRLKKDWPVVAAVAIVLVL
jgi:hypothetical protein